jgi:hypothetical protein
MSQSVSVPEKTLEHWSSQYVTYRYRSKAALWWPARGEDIDLGWLPTRPGKAVQLELKTATVVAPGVHDVLIDLGQLWEYRQRPRGRQPFYAFPKPDRDWDGNLAAAAIAGGLAVTELAFARSGPGWWFADWMVVLTTAQVAAVLSRELAAHGSRKRGKKGRLVRFDRTQSAPVWGSGAAVTPICWREFWPELERCGRVGWPQLIRLPASVVRAQGPYRPDHILGFLRNVVEILPQDQRTDMPIVTFASDPDGNYQVMSAVADDTAQPGQAVDEDADGDEDDQRQVVFLDVEALRLGG